MCTRREIEGAREKVEEHRSVRRLFTFLRVRVEETSGVTLQNHTSFATRGVAGYLKKI